MKTQGQGCPWAAVFMFVSSSCSLTVEDLGRCTSDAECRGAFGPLARCGSDRFCEMTDPEPRCASVVAPDLFSEAPQTESAPLLLGSVYLSTPLAQSARLPFVLARDEGGLPGAGIALVECTVNVDPSRFPERTSAQALDRVASFLTGGLQVPAIVTSQSSTGASALYERVQAQGVAMMASAATDPSFSDQDEGQPSNERPGLLWRTAKSTLLQGEALAWWLRGESPPVERVVLVHQTDDFGTRISRAFSEDFRRRGGRLTEYGFAPEDRGSLEAALTLASSGRFELIVVVGDRDLAGILAEVSRVSALDSVDVVLAPGDADNVVLEPTTDLDTRFLARLRGARVRRADPAQPIYQAYSEAFQTAFGARPPARSGAETYDAAWMILSAATLARASEGDVSGLSVARALRRLRIGAEIPLVPGSWAQDLSPRLGQGQSVNLAGASSPLDYDLGTEELPVEVELWSIATEDGQSSFQIEAVYPNG